MLAALIQKLYSCSSSGNGNICFSCCCCCPVPPSEAACLQLASTFSSNGSSSRSIRLPSLWWLVSCTCIALVVQALVVLLAGATVAGAVFVRRRSGCGRVAEIIFLDWQCVAGEGGSATLSCHCCHYRLDAYAVITAAAFAVTAIAVVAAADGAAGGVLCAVLLLLLLLLSLLSSLLCCCR
jgi:hypothetical protein